MRPATGHIFLARNAPGHVLAHELGHQLGGLYDEYFVREGCQGRLTRHDRNCSETRDPARVPWAARLASAPLEGCNGCTQGVWRPTDACRMGMDTTRPFCPVCRALLDDALAAWEPVPLLRVLCRLRPEGMEVVGSYPGSGPAGSGEVLRSLFFATVEAGREIVWLDSLAGDPFLRRGLMPGRPGKETGHAFHRMSEGDFVLDVPTRVAEAATHTAVYRLPEEFFDGKTLTTAEARRAIAQNAAVLLGRVPLPRKPDAR